MDEQDIPAASHDGTARLWSVSGAKLLTTFGSVGDGSIVFATFDRAGNYVLTCDEDGLATIWTPELAGPISTLEAIARQRAAPGLSSSRLSADISGG